VAIIYITQCAEDIIIHNIIQICTLFDLYIINVQKILQTVVGGVDGEGQMAMDSVSSCRVDLRGVGVEFNMCDEDGGESRFVVGVANFRQHRVREVEIVGCHSGFLVVRKI
jgi:hypothetical protein